MAIDFNVDIIQAIYDTKVFSDAAYQIPGTFTLPADFGIVSLASGVIAAGGTDYLANDLLTLVGGTFTTATILKVLTVSGPGAVLTFSIQDAGDYTDIPANPVATTDNSIAGAGFTLTASWTGFAQQRILTMVEIMRSYMSQMNTVHEAKLLHEVMGRMMAAMRFGPTWDITNMPLNSQAAALKFLASIRNMPIDM